MFFVYFPFLKTFYKPTFMFTILAVIFNDKLLYFYFRSC